MIAQGQAARAEAKSQRKEQAATTWQRPRELGNSIGMEFVLIQPGTFQRGSPASEAGRLDDEGPVHPVWISQPFYLGKYEVSQGQWEAVMRDNPPSFSYCGGRCPVESVFWEEVQEFIGWLNSGRG